jgi:hypothetical protein
MPGVPVDRPGHERRYAMDMRKIDRKLSQEKHQQCTTVSRPDRIVIDLMSLLPGRLDLAEQPHFVHATGTSSATIRRSSRPMDREAVAAGDGTFHTCSMFFARTN